MRIQERFDRSPSRSGGRTCKLQGCLNKTREQKPFCEDHLELNTYAGKVIRELEEIKRQDQAITRRNLERNEALNAFSAQEIVLALREYGPRSVKRLARDLNLELKVVWAYVKALAAEQVVTVTRSRKGIQTVSLVPELH